MVTRKIYKPRIATMLGSDSDLPQAVRAHSFLLDKERYGTIELVGQFTNSIHRNPADVIAVLSNLIGKVDAIIVGAGWANHLTGCVDAFLRNLFKDDEIVVFGVAFKDPDNEEHTQAAISGIVNVPGSSVVFNDYVGSEGCLQAAKDAVAGEYPVIQLKDQKSAVRRSIDKALIIGESWEDF